MRQDVGWFESQDVNQLPTKYHSNIAQIEASTGRVAAFVVYSISAMIGGIGASFIAGPVYACCLLACIPFTLAIGGYQNYTLAKKIKEDEKVFNKSGADAEQSLGSIKIVKAFGRENYEYQKYEEHLSVDEASMNSYSKRYGLSFGLIESLRYVLTFYGLLIGGVFIVDHVSISSNITILMMK